jgi:hypothetical protein
VLSSLLSSTSESLFFSNNLGSWLIDSLQSNAGNQTAMTLLAQAPGTIVQPVYFTMNNIRPYNQPVAQAITLVGAIYLLIFSFIVTMLLFPVREMM